MNISVEDSREMAFIVNRDEGFFSLHWKVGVKLKDRIGKDIFTAKKLLEEIDKLTKLNKVSEK
jgi:hypothetical protein